MEISAFTFIRNAKTLDYPVVEAITNLLPLVDEFVVNVGSLGDEPDDGTLDLVRSIDSDKIRIVQSKWNPHLATGAYVYAQQTNIALMNCQGRWAMYVQCDEIIHEQDFDGLSTMMQRYRDDQRVDGLALRQINFWGDYQTQFNIRPWTGRRKCWIVKPHHFVLSRGDAANFTVHPKYKERGRKLRVVETPARQFHYGSVKSLKAIAAKRENEQRFWDRGHVDMDALTDSLYYRKYPRRFFTHFDGDHPAVMRDRIAGHDVHLDLDSPQWRTELTFKERRQLARGWFADHVTERWTNRGDYVLLKPSAAT
ncbi:hypothetical protein HED60_06755 [Planctomycetales bacterium ZRK34]|nr:hypothetical protein HED60_06755 [Planctomycetales bacterium ZRK34]